MDISLSPAILLFFLASTLAYLAFLIKQGKFSALKLQINQSEARTFGIFAVCVGAFLLLRILLPTANAPVSAAVFFVTLIVPFIVRRLNIATEGMQIILLALVIALTAIFHTVLTTPIVLALLLALLTYKALENILFLKENRFDDIAPVSFWLAVQIWLAQTSGTNPNIDNILLSCLTITFLLKMIPSSFFASDLFLGKKIVISLSGGIVLLIILNKILLLPKLAILAGLFAAGILFSYYFSSTCKEDDEDITRLFYCIRFLVGLGILTIVSTRIFGDLGLVVLIPPCLLSGALNTVVFAGMFWSSKLLIQSFVSTYVANVTGINLMHTYCSGALYFGFLAILFLLALLKIKTKDWTALSAILLTGIAVPPGIIYLFHEESAASFLIASLVSGISLISFFPFLFKEQTGLKQDNLVLVPMMMPTVSLLFAPLIQIGNESTVSSRLQFVSVFAGLFLLIYLAALVINRISASRKPVSVPRD